MTKIRIALSFSAILMVTSVAIEGQSSRSQGATRSVRPPVTQPSQARRPTDVSSRKPTTAGKRTTDMKPETAAVRPETAGPKDPMGFRNYGQYVAATHVAKNLNIDFELLKIEMIDNKLSLGQAIKKLRPELPSQTIDVEVNIAEAAKEPAQNPGE